MRRYSASVRAWVTRDPGSTARPVRMSLGGMSYGMSEAEAVQLATDLAAAIEEQPKGERHVPVRFER